MHLVLFVKQDVNTHDWTCRALVQHVQGTTHNTLEAHPVEVSYARLQRPNCGGMDDWGIVGGTTTDCAICTAIQVHISIEQAGNKVVNAALRLHGNTATSGHPCKISKGG